MGWLIDRPGAEEHEGHVAMLGPDRRGSGSTGYEGVLFRNPRWSRGSDERFDVAVPWSEIIGWRVQCECGWRGTTWRREDAANDDSDAEDVFPEHMLLPGGRTLEDADAEEWRHHVRPLAAADGVRAATLALGKAAALDAAVVEARESDPPATWEQIGGPQASPDRALTTCGRPRLGSSTAGPAATALWTSR